MQKHTFESGAVRDEVKPRYDLIPLEGLRRLALIYDEGAKKYGDYNWHKGMPISDTINHAVEHLYRYLAGDITEDHLPKVAWAMFAVMYYEKNNPELFVK